MDSVFHFELPDSLIAQVPASPRDYARLLVVERRTGKLIDDYFYNIDKYLNPNSTIVVNNSKVEHCRYLFLDAKREIFATEKVNNHTVRALVRPGRVFKLGALVNLDDGISAQVTAVDSEGIRTIRFNVELNDERLVRASHVPLPPYISQDDTLENEYQTIYAKTLGSLAAPTAGLHFTPKLQLNLKKTFDWQEVTLHVGLGTFAPLKAENFATKTLHSEEYEVNEETFQALKNASHITAVGTTTTRTIESLFSRSTPLLRGATDIFITPPYDFLRVDSMVTNFHLPGTSLLLLVEAFMGSRQLIESVYHHAISNKYRFYSFGDAMLII